MESCSSRMLFFTEIIHTLTMTFQKVITKPFLNCIQGKTLSLHFDHDMVK